MQPEPPVRVRNLRNADLEDVVRIDALHTGAPKRDYWRGVFHDFLETKDRRLRIGLGADRGGEMVGYLFGEVRAFEFGSDECGWVFRWSLGMFRLVLQEVFQECWLESIRAASSKTASTIRGTTAAISVDSSRLGSPSGAIETANRDTSGGSPRRYSASRRSLRPMSWAVSVRG